MTTGGSIRKTIEGMDGHGSYVRRALAVADREDVSRLAFNPLTNIVLNLVLLPALGTIVQRSGGPAASSPRQLCALSRSLGN